MNGWMGKILRVNLTTGGTTNEPLDYGLARKYVGGKGFSIKVLYDELDPGIDPLGTENKLIFSAGPACGTIIPASQRWTVSAKSPLTGFIGDANCGGSFGAGLKYAGYDMVIVEGKSERPVYLFINSREVQIRDASHIWGRTTTETERIIKKEIGDPDIHIASIGTAGDNQVRFAAINNDNRTAGRTGMGAVMGSKGLKAIAAGGDKGVRVADPGGVEKVSREMYVNWQKNTEKLKALQEYSAGVDVGRIYNRLGIIPTKNYREGLFEPYNAVSERLKDELWLKPRACFSCPVACGHMYIVTKGPYKGTFGDGLYGSSIWYTSRFANPDAELMCKLTALSDQYGMDEADLSGVIGWLMECYDLGIITAADLDGIKMEWGNAEAILKITEKIAHREGVGALLAEGAKKASEVIGRGSEKYVMHVKGMYLDSRDPRGSKSWGFGYAVGSRGPDHCRHLVPDLADGEARFEEEGRGKKHKWYEDLRAFQNTLEICQFICDPRDYDWTGAMAEMFRNVTGEDMKPEEVLTVGERITNLDRAFNVREGLTRKDDSLPDRFLKESLPEGESKGHVVNLDLMLDEYYEARGWDRETGFPSKNKMKSLGLDEAANELESMGKLTR
ncbi:aldehyde ferredoxin oxidoreductase family protein [Thermodesulfobacteriota bacterium]